MPGTTWLPAAAAVFRFAFGYDGLPLHWGHDWGVPPDPEAVEALAARATGQAWRPAAPTRSSPLTTRARVRKLMRKNEAAAPGSGDPKLMLQYVRDVEARHTAWLSALADGEGRMTAAVRAGTLSAIGVLVSSPNADPGVGQHVRVPPEVVLNPDRVIRLNGALCWRGDNFQSFGRHGEAPYFADVWVDAAELRLLHPPRPMPEGDTLTPWDGITWRGFGAARRLNLGSRRYIAYMPYLPILEDWGREALILGAWIAFERAEVELKTLLRAMRDLAYGRQMAEAADGPPLAVGTHQPMPPKVFLNDRLTFDSLGNLHERPARGLWMVRNGHKVPYVTLFMDVKLDATTLRTAWGEHVASPPAPGEAASPASDADPRFPPHHDVLIQAAGRQQAEATTRATAHVLTATEAPVQPSYLEYSRKALGAWFILRVSQWPADAPYPSEKQCLADARRQFGTVPRGEFRAIRGTKTPLEWRKRGPRGPRN